MKCSRSIEVQHLSDSVPRLCLQVIEPDASKKDVYEAAFQRHYTIGKQIFEP